MVRKNHNNGLINLFWNQGVWTALQLSIR